jgi:hypothetical protein
VIQLNIVYETNGKGFLGWIVEFPGAYIRGETLPIARSKINDELINYGKWIHKSVQTNGSINEIIIQSDLCVEDADSNILLEYDMQKYNTPDEYNDDINTIKESSISLHDLYRNCKYKNIVDTTKIRKTFYGDVNATIETQYRHIVEVEASYLWNIGIETDTGNDILEVRERTIKLLNKLYNECGNIYKEPSNDNWNEGWTLRKVIRRIIWHDRIHGKAIERMERKLSLSQL